MDFDEKFRCLSEQAGVELLATFATKSVDGLAKQGNQQEECLVREIKCAEISIYDITTLQDCTLYLTNR